LRTFIQYCSLDLPGWKMINDLTVRNYEHLSKDGGSGHEISIIVNGRTDVALRDLKERIPDVKYYRVDQCLASAIIKSAEVTKEEGETHFYMTGCCTLLGHGGLDIIDEVMWSKIKEEKPFALNFGMLPFLLPEKYSHLMPHFTHNFVLTMDKLQEYHNRYIAFHQIHEDGLSIGKNLGIIGHAIQLGFFAATPDFVLTLPPYIDKKLTENLKNQNIFEEWCRARVSPGGTGALWEGEIRYATSALEDTRVNTYNLDGLFVHRGNAVTSKIWMLGHKGIIE